MKRAYLDNPSAAVDKCGHLVFSCFSSTPCLYSGQVSDTAERNSSELFGSLKSWIKGSQKEPVWKETTAVVRTNQQVTVEYSNDASAIYILCSLRLYWICNADNCVVAQAVNVCNRCTLPRPEWRSSIHWCRPWRSVQPQLRRKRSHRDSYRYFFHTELSLRATS